MVYVLFFAFILSYQEGPSCFEDLEVLLSNYLQPLISTLSTVPTWPYTGLPGAPPNYVVVASKSGPVETVPTVMVATALNMFVHLGNMILIGCLNIPRISVVLPSTDDTLPGREQGWFCG